ncbi:MAG: tRNA (adenosine(37)-N6)-dimethylallyltransferase MiaA [Pseudomonadota bacterium]
MAEPPSKDPTETPSRPAPQLQDALAGRTDPDRPILIAGPTASGKSGLAMALARAGGRSIVNADALQVYGGWHLLTARPGARDMAEVPHALFGHVPPDRDYSVGTWLREAAPLLDQHPAPVIVGGTGLYFAALTEGLADIPATSPDTRARATALLERAGLEALAAALDPDTRAGIDLQNPMRVQRAWEVQAQTGRGLAAWQRDTAPPLLPLENALPILLTADRDWLAARIAARFEVMLADGALEEARAMMPGWDPARLSSRAIGAAELIAHLRGELTLEQARAATLLATRQYAKRQRTWFRNRMVAWCAVDAQEIGRMIRK